MSDTILLSVKDMINRAFGDPNTNVVNFKLVQAVLLLLAKQLRILERKVGIDADLVTTLSPKTVISVTEVKVVSKKVSATSIKSAEPGAARSAADKFASKQASVAESRGMSKEQSAAEGKGASAVGSQRVSRETSVAKGNGASGAEGSGAEVKGTDGKGTAGKGSDGKGADGKVSEGRSADGKGTEGRASDQRGADGKGTEGKVSDGKVAESRVSEGRSADGKSVEGRGSNGRDTLGRGSDGKGAEGRRSEGSGAGGKSTEKRGTEGKGPGRKGASDAVKKSAEGKTTAGTEGKGVSKGGSGAGGKGTEGQGAAKKARGTSRDTSLTDVKIIKEGKVAKETKMDPDKRAVEKRPSTSSSVDFNNERLFIVEKIPDDTKAPKDNILSVVGEKEFNILLNRVNEIEQALAMEGIPILGAEAIKSLKTGKQDSDIEGKSLDVRSVVSIGGAKSGKSAIKGGTVTTPVPLGGNMAGVVTFDELDEAMCDLRREIAGQVDTNITKINCTIDLFVKMNAKTEAKITELLAIGTKIDHMEEIVGLVRDQLDTVDSGLSAQIVLFQEQLSQLQHDLETGMENMAETIASQGDANAIMEIISNIQNLQSDFDRSRGIQQELDEQQRALYTDIRAILKDMEFLREAKSDRDEVADALKDKVGIADLNGLVAINHFEAVQEDLEKKIASAYNKFYAYELVWQEAIDDIYRAIDLKADRKDLEALRENIQTILNAINAKLYEITEILGEPRAAAIERALFRDTTCLSCLSPAKMDIKKIDSLPVQPALRNKKVEELIKEDGDHPDAFHTNPNHDIPERQYCSRYCGGSHTMISRRKFHVHPNLGFNVTRMVREHKSGIGNDGRTYCIDEDLCSPCGLLPNPAAVA